MLADVSNINKLLLKRFVVFTSPETSLKVFNTP